MSGEQAEWRCYKCRGKVDMKFMVCMICGLRGIYVRRESSLASSPVSAESLLSVFGQIDDMRRKERNRSLLP